MLKPPRLSTVMRMLDEEISRYELEHGMSTEELKKGLSNGTVSESMDMCRWLIAHKIRERIGVQK